MMGRRIKHIINHWSVTMPETTVADLRRVHLARGYKDVAYHRIILHPKSFELKGQLIEDWWQLVKLGRPLDDDIYIESNEVGAHALGYNANSVGVCTVGHPDYGLDPLQREAIIQVNKIFWVRFELPKTASKGHQEVNATMCPGPEIMEVIKELRNG